MDAASTNTLNRLEAELSGLSSIVEVLSSNPSLADSDDRSEDDSAIVLFKAALNKLPQVDSFYVGYENGCWLQVRRLDVLSPVEREKLGAPPGAVYNVNLVRPNSEGALPMRRIFEDEEGNKIGQFDLRDYGYDPRTRVWYRDTKQAGRTLVSAPYASFSIDTAMITLSAPLRGHVGGIIAADLKLDKFSKLVYAHAPESMEQPSSSTRSAYLSRTQTSPGLQRMRGRIPRIRSSPKFGKSGPGWWARS
jgi:adenylate cyclase